MQQIQWQDRFNIGVEVVDQAHRRLFSIVQRIMDLHVEKHEDKFACVEGIKYFKSYTLKHFAEEEAYMLKIGYPGYPAQKKIHDKMRQETLPALEKLLYDSDFSPEAVQRFIGVCTGWLTSHILIEDRAITGRNVREPVPDAPDDETAAIRTLILYPIQDLFGCGIQFLGTFPPEEASAAARYYELTYHTQGDGSLRLTIVAENDLLVRAAGLMFSVDPDDSLEIVTFAIQEIAQSLLQRAAASFGEAAEEYRLTGDRFLTREEFAGVCAEHAPQYSLLFQTNHGRFALCFDRLPMPAGGAS